MRMLGTTGRVLVASLGAVVACAGCGGKVSNEGADSSGNSDAGAAWPGSDGTSTAASGAGSATGGASFATGGASFATGGAGFANGGAGFATGGTGGMGGMGGSPGGAGGAIPAYPSGGAAGQAGSASDAGGAFVVCGAVTCWALAPSNRFNVTMVPASPCCVDPATGICGTLSMSGSGVCTAVPAPDPSCPSAVVPGGVLTGCCTHGACGLDYSYVGQGCVDDASPSAAIYLQGVPYQHCDGAP